jgi:hypothetical protein
VSVRNEIRGLCIAHDKQIAEDREWLARRQAQARPIVRKSDNPAGLLFKTCANEPAPAAVADSEPSDAELSDADLLSEALIDAGGRAIADLRREWSRELEVMGAQSRENREQIAELRGKLAELRGQVSALLVLIGGDKSKSGEIVDLPRLDLRRRDVA